jgi:hypothetical protein
MQVAALSASLTCMLHWQQATHLLATALQYLMVPKPPWLHLSLPRQT